ncbi:MAG: ArsA family ATPase [Thermodesulfobacteriota bacterium]
MNRAKNLFFVGKGGVGKSTSSALNSLFLAQKGFKVLLISLDPAHNQSDIFERQLSSKETNLVPNLSAIEIEQERWIKKYLSDIQRQIKRTYSYLTAFNLDRYFNVIKHAPGLEEYALILAFKDIRKRFAHYDFLVFDMPPTALALKFFNIPYLSLIWIEHILALREEIIKKRDIITKITIINKERETDKILNKLKEMKNEYLDLKDTFESTSNTHIKLVLNPDKLSFAESLRILHFLKDININLSQLILNKMKKDLSGGNDFNVFGEIPRLTFPDSEEPLLGVDRLQEFLIKNKDSIEKKLIEV